MLRATAHRSTTVPNTAGRFHQVVSCSLIFSVSEETRPRSSSSVLVRLVVSVVPEASLTLG
ncbi:hypothetical protein AW736_23895 [Termitidicoccus mucosus]|uniref:Uncharacterized protein n=1 Tax=Termitidicoccus mucosus TaxID=1184151 RepID=A0A178IBF1_9BACT|nr:hypothetical protein AW736_23895 [Opitutaceae bacterium TSB47]